MRLAIAGEAMAWEPVMLDATTPVILVIDQEPQILQLVRVILTREGYRVLCARSLRQATRLCRRSRNPISLVLVDASTVEVEDREWLQKVQSEHPAPKLIIMSAASPGQGDFAGDAILSKPFTPRDLCQAVERALQKGMAAGSA